VPGFLLQVKLISAYAFPGCISELYHYEWFVGFTVSGVVYRLMMKSYVAKQKRVAEIVQGFSA
jgi:NCS1 family nucleobase:cation symporter-1